MMSINQIIVILVVCIPLLLAAFNRLRLDLAALSMAVVLGLLQCCGLSILGPANDPQAALKIFSGANQSVIIILISLFILTKGLEKSGVTNWIARRIVRRGGTQVDRLVLLFASVTAFLSLFMNDLAACALIVPAAIETARQTGVKPSKLLMPVAYGSLLGGSATYFTTANIVMSDLLKTAVPPQEPLYILSFLPTGGLIAVAGLLFLWKFAGRLLPEREPNLQIGGSLAVDNKNSNSAVQPVHPRNAVISAGLLGLAIIASTAGFSLEIGLFTAAILILLLNIIRMEDAYQAIEWQVLFLIAGMYPVSLAMIQTGLAGTLASWFVTLLAPAGAIGLAGGAYLLTMLVTQVIGGQVAALVVGPVVISAAIQLGANPQMVAVAAAIGCSASFLTPMAHPVNLLVVAPGNYKFSDFFKVGWLLTLLSFGMLLVGLAIFWR